MQGTSTLKKRSMVTNGNAGRDFQVRGIGQGDDAVGLVVAHHTDELLLAVIVILGKAEHHLVAAAFERHVDVVGQQGEKRGDGVGNNQGDKTAAAAFQRLGAGIDPVIQLFDGGFHPQPVTFAHRPAVDDPGHGAKGHAGFAGHIAHGGGLLAAHGGNTPFLWRGTAMICQHCSTGGVKSKRYFHRLCFLFHQESRALQRAGNCRICADLSKIRRRILDRAHKTCYFVFTVAMKRFTACRPFSRRLRRAGGRVPSRPGKRGLFPCRAT